MTDTLTLESAHNFGIYTKSGKRTIFQIDFSSHRINLIERGKINKSYNFDNVDQFDSEENLHIVIRFRNNNKTLEFDADTAEEKYTICRLLGIIVGNETVEHDDVERRENGIRSRLSTKKQVIKEGILEKRGNTKIPTWSKRRLQVCPGEFSYYKPGEEVALNLVQLWENSTSISGSSHNAFTVAVRDRTYLFRVTSDKGINQELERDKWIEAFKQASQRKRATFLLLEMSRNTDYSGNTHQGLALPSIPSVDEEEEEATYYNQSKSSGSEGSSLEMVEELEPRKYWKLETVWQISMRSRPSLRKRRRTLEQEVVLFYKMAINELDEVLNDIADPTRPRELALSVVQKTSPLLISQTRNRARPPALNRSFKSDNEDNTDLYDTIPNPDYSPIPSPTPGEDKQTTFEEGVGITKDRPSGKYQTVIKTHGSLDSHVTNQSAADSARESGLYSRVIRNQADKGAETDDKRRSGDYQTSIKPAGAVDVMPKFTEIPKLRKIGSQNSSEESERKSPREVVSSPDETSLSVKQIQANIENTYANETSESNTSNKDNGVSNPREGKKKPAPAPSGPRHAPPPGPKAPPVLPPAPTIPAPPPPDFTKRPSRGKLKQVHWTRTPKPLVANSIWGKSRDRTNMLNLKLLEEQFSLKERDLPPATAPKGTVAGKQLLIDSKRAQNLGIFMSGMKNDCIGRLVDVLNSVKEDDGFPSEKLTTIRRYQPTEDEIDMYKAYRHKRHELHPVDQFMLDLCEIPCLNIRIDLCLTLWEFPWQYDGTWQLVEQVHAACDELLNSQMVVAVLEYMLAIGNYLNRNWSESNVTPGFQVTSLEKMLDMRGKDTGYTMVHFLVEQIKLSDPGLLVWADTVQTVKKCEQVTVKTVSAETDVLKGDLNKIKRHLKTLKSKFSNSTRHDNKFQQDAKNVTVEYEMKLDRMERRCNELQNKYRQVLTRFGEPLYQKSDLIFEIIAKFSDKFKAAQKDLETRGLEKKDSVT